MRMLHRLWRDESGFVVSTELVLIATILVIGMVVGLATVRNAVVQELSDVALTVGNLNQSYQCSGVSGRANSSATAGSYFTDQLDFCDGFAGDDCLGCEPSGVNVRRNPIDEGDSLPAD